MKYLFALLFTLTLSAEQLRIAVIDTGINQPERFNLCKDGMVDLTGHGMQDVMGHGTLMVALIHNFALTQNKDKYCIDVIKFYHNQNTYVTTDAIELAKARGAHIINASFSGQYIMSEDLAIKKFLANDLDKLVVTAAGNDNKRLNRIGKCSVYPACSKHKRVLVAGNGVDSNNRQNKSNYGSKVDIWVDGSLHVFDNKMLSGTSDSAAIVSGMVIALVVSSKYYSEQDQKDSKHAIGKSLEAIYMETGTDKIAHAYVDMLKEKSPEFLKKSLFVVLPVVQTITTGKVIYRWEF